MDVYVVLLDPELTASNRSVIVGISARLQGAELMKAEYLRRLGIEAYPDRDDWPVDRRDRLRARQEALCAPHVRIENHDLKDVE